MLVSFCKEVMRWWGVRSTFSALAVFEELHPLKGGSTADEFVRELGFVSLVTVDLLVSIAAIVWRWSQTMDNGLHIAPCRG